MCLDVSQRSPRLEPNWLLSSAHTTLDVATRRPTMSTSLLYAPLRVSRRTARSLTTLAPVPVNAALRHHTPWQTRSASTQPAYEGHVPLNWFEHGFLTLGSAFMALANPRRGGTSL